MCRRISIALLTLLLIGCAPKPAHVTITWQTASEMNTAGFVIERGYTADGPFEKVSPFIPSSDDPFIGHDYEYIDSNVEAGRTYYYQLKTVTNANAIVDAGQLSAVAR